MIKRRFYRVEHADGDDAADSSSSSSDSEIDEHATESESESNSDDNAAADADTEAINRIDETSSVSSGSSFFLDCYSYFLFDEVFNIFLLYYFRIRK